MCVCVFVCAWSEGALQQISVFLFLGKTFSQVFVYTCVCVCVRVYRCSLV